MLRLKHRKNRQLERGMIIKESLGLSMIWFANMRWHHTHASHLSITNSCNLLNNLIEPIKLM